jgi:hypothetical protein
VDGFQFSALLCLVEYVVKQVSVSFDGVLERIVLDKALTGVSTEFVDMIVIVGPPFQRLAGLFNLARLNVGATLGLSDDARDFVTLRSDRKDWIPDGE